MMFNIYKDEYGIHGKFSIFSYNLHLKIHKDYNLAYTTGLKNVSAGQRLLFVDYDNSTLKLVTEEIKYLQEKFFLSDAYIFKSSQKPDGFHVIILDRLKYKMFLKVMSYTSCDEYYRIMPIHNDHNGWVLRTEKKCGSDKPKLIKILTSSYQNRQKSLAHALFLKYNYGVDISKIKKLDKNKILHVIKYGTLNFIEAKDINKTKERTN